MRSLIIRRTLYIPAAATRSRWTPTQHPFILSAVAIAVVGMMLFHPTHRASMCRKRSARQAFTHCRSLFTIRISLIRTCIYTWIGVRVMHTTLHSHIYQHVYSIKTKKKEKSCEFLSIFFPVLFETFHQVILFAWPAQFTATLLLGSVACGLRSFIVPPSQLPAWCAVWNYYKLATFLRVIFTIHIRIPYVTFVQFFWPYLGRHSLQQQYRFTSAKCSRIYKGKALPNRRKSHQFRKFIRRYWLDAWIMDDLYVRDLCWSSGK